MLKNGCPDLLAEDQNNSDLKWCNYLLYEMDEAANTDAQKLEAANIFQEVKKYLDIDGPDPDVLLQRNCSIPEACEYCSSAESGDSKGGKGRRKRSPGGKGKRQTCPEDLPTSCQSLTTTSAPGKYIIWKIINFSFKLFK